MVAARARSLGTVKPASLEVERNKAESEFLLISEVILGAEGGESRSSASKEVPDDFDSDSFFSFRRLKVCIPPIGSRPITIDLVGEGEGSPHDRGGEGSRRFVGGVMVRLGVDGLR